MSTTIEQPIKIQWFNTEKAVFNCLSLMIKDGWAVSNTLTGVVHGNVVARPIKVTGNKKFTGVGLWNINP